MSSWPRGRCLGCLVVVVGCVGHRASAGRPRFGPAWRSGSALLILFTQNVLAERRKVGRGAGLKEACEMDRTAVRQGACLSILRGSGWGFAGGGWRGRASRQRPRRWRWRRSRDAGGGDVGLLVAAARGIVERAGEGQLDASGERLISHAGRVGGVAPLFAGPVAWLRDVLAASSGMPGAVMDEREP